MQQTLVSKSEFAAMINVTPGRISQYIAAGQISRDAVVGSGQRAKIDAERARADLRLTLDVAQRLGNGMETRLDAGAGASGAATADGGGAPASGGAGLPGGGGALSGSGGSLQLTGIDYEIKQQKLETARRANRNGAIADAQSRGQLIDTDAARAEMTRVASALMDIFDGGLTDMALAVAAAFQLPQRDVKHLMRKEFRKLREVAAKQMKARAVSLPDHTDIVLEAEDTDQAVLQ